MSDHRIPPDRVPNDVSSNNLWPLERNAALQRLCEEICAIEPIANAAQEAAARLPFPAALAERTGFDRTLLLITQVANEISEWIGYIDDLVAARVVVLPERPPAGVAGS